MKVLLVSDLEHYATRNVFEDYLKAFGTCGINVKPFRMWELNKTVAMGVMYSLLFSDIALKRNGITHVLFVTGTNVPQDIVESIPQHIKVGIIGTDDPHSSKHVMAAFASKLDYYFTNEKKMDKYDERFHYIPIASSSTIPTDIVKDHMSDICFIGSVYPNRLEPLEKVVRWALKNEKKPLIVGPMMGVPPDSIIRTVAKEIMMSNLEAMRYMLGARVSINIDRDVHWNSQFGGENPMLLDVGEPYSSNPRTFEVPLNKSIQLFINPRQEAIDVFGDDIFVANNENIEEVLQKVFDTPKSQLDEIRARAFEIARNHTYESRAQAIIKILNKE